MNAVCIRCGSADGGLTVDLDDGDTLRCLGCEAEYSVGDVVEVIESWGRLLPWLLAHPARKGEPVCEAVA
jgi:hypothetical protein